MLLNSKIGKKEGICVVEQNLEMPTMTVTKMTQQLSKAYVSLINAKKPLRSFPSVMLWGPPGVGKSQGVRQIAKGIEARTGKTVAITDVRLLLFNPVDLRGIPTANADKTLAIWLKPKIFQMDDSEAVINILFLDEISAAPQSVQAAAYQITLDRMVGEHKLPDNCIVIAAGNRVTDKSVAYNMPKALANRLCHIEIGIDGNSWHDWAIRYGIHPYIVGYLEYNPVALMKFDPSGTELAFPTPRSWEMVSNILNDVSDDLNATSTLVAGCIGRATTSSLRTWCELYKEIPSARDIFQGKTVDTPKPDEIRIALRSELVAYAREHPDREGIYNSIEYACKLAWSFRGDLLHDYYLIPQVRPLLEENPVFRAAVRNGLK